MRLDWPPPWDHVSSVLISILTLIIVLLSPEQVLTFSAPLVLLLVIPLPGHLFVSSLFPAIDDLEARGRALLTVGSSAAIAALMGLVLNFTPRGLQPASLTIMLSLLALFLAVVSYLRWSALPRRKRLALRSRRSLRNTGILPVPSCTMKHFLLLSLGLAAILALATSGFDLSLLQSPSGEKGFSEFSVSWPESGVQTGAAGTALVSIINREHSLVNYTLQLEQNNTTLFEKDVHLEHNQSWQEPVSYRLSGPAGSKRLDFLLFKEGDSLYPYREERLLINVSENDSNEPANLSAINLSSEKAAIMEQKSRVVVLGVGDGGSHDSSRSKSSSGSKPSYQTDTKSKKDHEQELIKEELVNEDLADEEPEQTEGKELPADRLVAAAETGVVPGDLQSKVFAPEPDADSPQTEVNPPPEPNVNSPGSKAPISPSEATEKPPLPEEKILATATAQKANAAGEDTLAAASADDKKDLDASDKAQEAGTVDGTPKADADASPSQTSQEPAPSSSGESDASEKAGETASSDKDKSVTLPAAGISQEINSWVGTRVTSSGKSRRAYESQNIRYVRDSSGERAVLGRSASNVGEPAQSRSREPRRLG